MGPYLDRHVANVAAALDAGIASPEAPGPSGHRRARRPPRRAGRRRAAPRAGARSSGSAGRTRSGGGSRPSWSRPSARSSGRPSAAIADLIAERVLPRARPNDRPGLGVVPGGADAYRRLVRAHTSLDLGPEEIHAIGLDEIERIDAELGELGGRALGTRGPAEPPATGCAATRRSTSAGRTRCSRPPSRRSPGRRPRSRTGSGSCPGRPARSSRWAPTRRSTRRSPTTSSRPRTAAGPAATTSTPRRPETRPRYEAEALAFHESVPGHHLQIAIGQELAGLPAFRRHAGSTAFVEGWGLYTERLSDEMGLYSGDLDRIGIASFDAWRACRLVVDTGMHALGWSRDRGDRVHARAHGARPEQHRQRGRPLHHLAGPGARLQARPARDPAAARRGPGRLGSGFDIRAFHDAVLSQGALPLPVLRAVVERTFATG